MGPWLKPNMSPSKPVVLWETTGAAVVLSVLLRIPSKPPPRRSSPNPADCGAGVGVTIAGPPEIESKH